MADILQDTLLSLDLSLPKGPNFQTLHYADSTCLPLEPPHSIFSHSFGDIATISQIVSLLSSLSRRSTLQICDYVWLMHHVPEALKYGPVSRALVAENENDTIDILQKSPSSISRELSNFRETPLHISADWPRGLELMTQFARESVAAILHDYDSFGRTPIQHALLLENPDTVNIFLTLGAYVDLEDTQQLEHTLSSGHPASPRLNDAVVLHLSRKLARQRKDLCELALASLSPSQISQFGIQSGHMVQNNAYDVAQAIKACPVTLPKQNQTIRPGSLYHSCMSANLAQSLLQVGFDEPCALSMAGLL